MNIDWSKAPEGANYRDAGGNWLRFKNNQWFAWSGASGGYWFTIGKHNLQKPLTQKIVSTVADLLDMGYLVSPALHMQFCGRVKRNSEWTGEGLPPVGTVCEWKEKTGFSWVQATVLFISESSVVMQRSDGFEWQMLTKRTVFRELKTPEQIAEEKRKEAINEMAELSLYGHYAFTLAQAKIACAVLYDKGYRKFEIVDAKEEATHCFGLPISDIQKMAEG